MFIRYYLLRIFILFKSTTEADFVNLQGKTLAGCRNFLY